MLKSVNYIWISSEILSDRIDGGFYRKEDIVKLNKIYKSGMQVKSLIDISSNIKDGPHDGYKFVDDGVLFIRSQNIKDAVFDMTDKKYISKEFHEKFKKSWLEVGDLLVTRIGEYYGNAAVVSPEYKGCNINHAIAKVKLKKNYNPYYVCAYINSPTGNRIYRRLGKSFTSPRVNLNDYSDFFLPIPSPEIQKYIGDKVRKAEELREEAKRLKNEAEEIINKAFSFKELDLIYIENKAKFQWINTDILIDRIDGNYYEEKYIETINHMKRKSKNYVTLNSLIDSIYTGKKPIYDKKGADVCFVQSGNISSNFLEIDNKEKVDLSKYNQILFGDLLIAKDGETIGKIAINLTNETIIINEHTYCVRLKEEYKHYSAYIYYLLINDYINPLIRREATGSAQKGLNLSFTENIIIPDLEENIIMNLYNLELRRCDNIYKSKQLIQEAKQDVEDLIEGKFDMSKIKVNN